MDCYKKLRPWTEIERCECNDISALLLIYQFTDNPICCFECRNEVDPERLGLTCEIVDQLASCFIVYGALYELWLDSGEYEVWAKKKLVDPQSQVNVKGMAVAKEMTNLIPTYFWWFLDTDDGEVTACPNCKNPLNINVKFGTGKCNQCYIVI